MADVRLEIDIEDKTPPTHWSRQPQEGPAWAQSPAVSLPGQATRPPLVNGSPVPGPARPDAPEYDWMRARANVPEEWRRTAEERRRAAADPFDPANLPTRANKEREAAEGTNPFDKGKPGMGGLDRLLYQSGMGRLGNLAAMMDKYAEASAMGKGTGMAGLGVASAISAVVGAAAEAIGGFATKVLQVSETLASNDYAQTIRAVTTGMVDLAKQVPIVGEALGGVLNAIVGPANALIDTFKSFANRGKELSGYDPRIAQAEAMAEVNTILADIKEAQQMGGEYAELIRLENELSIAWRESILPIKKVIVEWLVENADGIKETLKTIAGTIESILSFVRAIGSGLSGEEVSDTIQRKAKQLMKEVEAKLKEIERNTRPKEEIDPTAQLFAVLGSGQGARVGRPADLGLAGVGGGLAPAIVEPNPAGQVGG